MIKPECIKPKSFIKNYKKRQKDAKKWKEIRKLTAEQSEDHTTTCFLDYDYIKNYYKLVAVDLSIQKELGADPKPIRQKKLIEKLKN